MAVCCEGGRAKGGGVDVATATAIGMVWGGKGGEQWHLQFPTTTVPVRFFRQAAQSGAKLTYTPEEASQ